MDPTSQAGHRPAAPGHSAAEAYHWPQVGQHPAKAAQLLPGAVSPYHLNAQARAAIAQVAASHRAALQQRRAQRLALVGPAA